MAKLWCNFCGKYFKGKKGGLLCPDCVIAEYAKMRKVAKKINSKQKNDKN